MLQNDPSCWDLRVHELLSRASSRMYIMRTCRFNGYSKEKLTLLFDTYYVSILEEAVRII